jgi:hypothetical protein
VTQEEQVEEIKGGLVKLLVGKDKALTIVAALSIATTSAFMVGMPKLELQEMLIRLYDSKVRDAKKQ